MLTFTIQGQEDYNNCDNALELCPSTVFTVNNINANSTVCPNCEDDFNFCFSGENTVWFTFTTNNEGGSMSAIFNSIAFQNLPGQGNGLQAAIIEAALPCIPSSYELVSNCESNALNSFMLTATDLLPNTTYYIIVNGTMGTTSNAEATFNLQINGPAVARNHSVAVGTSTSKVCKGNTVVMNAHIEECDDPGIFQWYVNGELVGQTQDTLFLYSNLQDQDQVTVKVSCFDQCRDTIESYPATFTVYDFLVDAGPDLHIISGESTQLLGESDENDILWTPDYNISNPTVIRPVVGPESTTTYFLTVSNGHCSITDEMTVFVDDRLEVPNTFSPNNDGVNDTWDILGIENFPDCHIQIYSRWGQLVFQTTGYVKEKRWDGTSKSGAKLSEGAYYYVINLRDKNFEKPLKGTVSIVR